MPKPQGRGRAACELDRAPRPVRRGGRSAASRSPVYPVDLSFGLYSYILDATVRSSDVMYVRAIAVRADALWCRIK